MNHIVDDSLQDFQVLAEDVKSVGKPIFEAWLGYADTLSPVHSARQESIDSPGHIITKPSANLANQYSSITQAHNSAPHQSLVEVPTSVKSMTTILPLSCSNIVGKKTLHVLPRVLLHLKQVLHFYLWVSVL